MFSHLLPAARPQQPTPTSSSSSSSASSFASGGGGGGSGGECDISARFFRPQSGFDSTLFSPLENASHSRVDSHLESGAKNSTTFTPTSSGASDASFSKSNALNSDFNGSISASIGDQNGNGLTNALPGDAIAENGIDDELPPSRLEEANHYRDSSMSFRYLHPASTLDSTTDSVAMPDGDEVRRDIFGSLRFMRKFSFHTSNTILWGGAAQNYCFRGLRFIFAFLYYYFQPDAGPLGGNAGFKLSLDLTNVSIPSLGFSASGSGGKFAQNPFDADASPQHLSDSVFNETDVISDVMVKEVR